MKSVATLANQRLVGREPNYQAPAKQAVPPQVSKFVDRLFERLKLTFPAWRQAFSSDEEFNEAKRLWLEALVRNNVLTAEQFKQGIAKAEQMESPFLPSVGQFIGWCKGAENGLPTAENLWQTYRTFIANRWRYEFDENYPWQSGEEYYLVMRLKREVSQGNLNNREGKVRAKELIVQMAKELAQGKTFKKPDKIYPLEAKPKLRSEAEWRFIFSHLRAGKRLIDTGKGLIAA